jgi:hypothetical protein
VSVQPTIAISRFQCKLHEIVDAVDKNRLRPDGTILCEGGVISCVKVKRQNHAGDSLMGKERGARYRGGQRKNEVVRNTDGGESGIR